MFPILQDGRTQTFRLRDILRIIILTLLLTSSFFLHLSPFSFYLFYLAQEIEVNM